MEGASPARLYATLIGGTLVIAGIIGFFYSSSFGEPGKVDDVFGILAVNGWHNVVHIVTGALGLAVAGSYGASRGYAIGLGSVYLAIAFMGFVAGDGDEILNLIPVNTEDNFFHLLLGVAGLGAGVATPGTPAPSLARAS